ncbi:MAG: hypothetical protein ACT4QF_12860 [Sporichthyaceae bacterium]|jgi:hypothetical protein
MDLERTFECVDCDGERVFAAVECVDGHGAACLEYACTGCGAAVFADPPAFAERASVPLRRAA